MSEDVEYRWEVAVRGLQRFFEEGKTSWSKQEFCAVFPDESYLDSPYIQEKLKQLEKNGCISLVGSDDTYLRILRFPEAV